MSSLFETYKGLAIVIGVAGAALGLLVVAMAVVAGVWGEAVAPRVRKIAPVGIGILLAAGIIGVGLSAVTVNSSGVNCGAVLRPTPPVEPIDASDWNNPERLLLFDEINDRCADARIRRAWMVVIVGTACGVVAAAVMSERRASDERVSRRRSEDPP